ncbi:exported heme-molybdoenzyme molybdopterin-containing subunit YedY; TAT export [Thiomonas arsenitoxydans]|uniref:Protein-methionine-sulfoxide reductase catalytic subunit MsrP n=1 Tax=Thiomonas arsenitoxydans (strain DSM 22701 / CIP 110005 / 3As) TaxID=426114 RepID=D6CKT1_THIA3|nr:protein-methionine-sulfoxide reductase catalytic subunit MsrP [Thiomonas arsenitoxydans]CAZ87549.1 putative Oxidoreductase, molybdopterin binding [Thiomonas arsenitoxydans]CQR27095.1 exported heme-molybdoenzyme molybdopterin-containing subunit YedY; TAT export [Thiomonas arsenitoxydans]CQR29912.1 exported heme-molybdoenzyme molybdopterin-containing subunit YedY; TAT export [Thiomonas arsenitoxydans]CQR29927.1 exported heme-molybdoenzyme molybdopterin-containing subunit YedY; TAT export [Thio
MSKRQDQGFEHPHSSEITPKAVYKDRRHFLAAAGVGAAAGVAALTAHRAQATATPVHGGLPAPGKLPALAAQKNTALSTTQATTPYKDVTTYNNFYEFGTSKSDPSQNAGSLKTRPWTVVVEGEVHKPRTFGIDDLLKLAPMEERIYRHRCVEGWAMVVPWLGYSLSNLLKAVEPTGNAKYVEYITLLDPAEMPGQNDPILQWPYLEGLRMDEAMHPLTLLTFGLYGEVLPNQDGAPMRMVIPWKYGFKGGKSIVKIRLVEKQPVTSWMRAVPQWYGFYSNVNPDVSPQNWSQANERMIGQGGAFGGLFAPRIPTQLFNGYGAQVASLYQGMNLKKFF